MSPYMTGQNESTEDVVPRHRPRSQSFSVSPAEYRDIRRLVDIEFRAFENEKTNHILSYRDHDIPAHFNRAVRSYLELMDKADSVRRRLKSPPRPAPRTEMDDIKFFKVTDAETDEIISWAKSETKAYTAEELATPADVGHEGESQMNRDWFALNENLRRDYMGTKRHCYIGMVATHPTSQKLGAGTMVLSKILEAADDAGVECYLEATDTAKPLYERHGFYKVNELRFDPTLYGIDGYNVERQTVMVRPAVDSRNKRQELRSWEEATTTTARS